jgi:hypothetical protein
MATIVTRATKGVPLTATDHDNNLDAILTLHKGDAAPTVIYACMLWADTTNTLLKMRNTANDAWVTLGALDTNDAFGGISELSEDSSPQLGGYLDANGNYIQTEKGGDITSADPLVIDTDGDYFDVTGTVSFTAMTVAADRQFTLQFDAVLTMTHHLTNLDLPSEANITTAAGDVATFQSTGANTVQCINYTKADGTAVVDANTTYSAGSSSALGLIKLEDNAVQTTAASAITTTAARTYGLQVNASGQGVVNVPWSDTDTVYSHPTYDGDDIDVDTTALTGATVVSDIDINVTTDTSGHVTDANGSISTRTLTLANLGYTGATDANNYSHPTGAGNKHIPTSGSSGQFLKYSSSGTATWASDNDTVYTHPTTDGSLHVPATSTTNNGKLLTAGATAGAISWEDAPVSLPTQTGNADKQLTTNGSSASWTATNTTTKGLYEHEHTIDADYSITSGNNAMSAGPITIDSGYSVTVPTGSTWVIV